MPEIRDGQIAPPQHPRLAYSQAGSGRDVVLLHGAIVTRQDMVLALFSTLAERFRVTAFDRPGHGESGRMGPTGSTWRQAEAVQAACEALRLERPVFVGHSYGGAVALAHALQFPHASSGVVAIAPIVVPEVRLEHLLFAPRAIPGLGRLIAPLASAVLDPLLLPILWRAMFLPQAMPERYAELFPFDRVAQASRTEAEGEDAALLNLGLAQSALNYGRCATPVRLLTGDRDMVVNNLLHSGLLTRLAPDAHREALPGLGHMAHHFAQPRVLDAVTQLAA